MVATGSEHTSAAALLGSLEYPVMQSLWARFPQAVGDVLGTVNAQRAAGDALAYTTVMTVLSRLYDKGVVDREKQGRSYQYRPRFTEDELVRRHSQDEVHRLVQRFGPVALAQFASALQETEPELLARVVQLAEGDEDA